MRVAAARCTQAPQAATAPAAAQGGLQMQLVVVVRVEGVAQDAPRIFSDALQLEGELLVLEARQQREDAAERDGGDGPEHELD